MIGIKYMTAAFNIVTIPNHETAPKYQIITYKGNRRPAGSGEVGTLLGA